MMTDRILLNSMQQQHRFLPLKRKTILQMKKTRSNVILPASANHPSKPHPKSSSSESESDTDTEPARVKSKPKPTDLPQPKVQAQRSSTPVKLGSKRPVHTTEPKRTKKKPDEAPFPSVANDETSIVSDETEEDGKKSGGQEKVLFKRKFETHEAKKKKGIEPRLLRPHDRALFEFSKKIWGEWPNGLVEKPKPLAKYTLPRLKRRNEKPRPKFRRSHQRLKVVTLICTAIFLVLKSWMRMT